MGMNRRKFIIMMMASGSNLIANGGFEIAGTGGADVFASWTEDTSNGGTITDETVEIYLGPHAVKLGTDADGGYSTVTQTIATTIGKTYRFYYAYKNSGVPGGSNDAGDTGWIECSATGGFDGNTPLSATYAFAYHDFVADAVSTNIKFYSPETASKDCYFTAIAVRELP
jgi:hypothetical protein